jgi:predicted MFS family arabinose efflux permease
MAIHRNIPILAVAQAIGISGVSGVGLVSGIISTDLAPSPALATLPNSLLVIGVALATIPATLLARRIGRRRGFLAAAAISGLASLLAALGLYQDSFPLFCLAIFVFGLTYSYVQQYRFAATESVPAAYSSRAISYVLVGGIVAGFLGPEIATRTQDAIPAGLYLGSFVSIAVLNLLAIPLFWFYKDVARREEDLSGDSRPLRQIAAQPLFLVAVLAGATAYGIMTLIMTATPIQMKVHHGFSLATTAFVLQSHIIAMYLPSLFSGVLIARLGLLRVMLVGVFLLFLTTVAALSGSELANYWSALVLLGVGWNFLFVGGTVLLTRTYFPAERFKAQAANDFSIFGIQAIASVSAGTLLYLSTWSTLLLASLPILLLVLLAILLARQRISPALA